MRRRARAAGTVAVAILISLGAGSFVGLGRVACASTAERSAPAEEEATRLLVRELQSRTIRHVYCTDPLLQWKVIFWSKDRIRARWLDPRDRVPSYPRSVDDALFSGRRTALVGYLPEAARVEAALGRMGISGIRTRAVAGVYMFIERPPAELLRALGFRLNPNPAAGTSPREDGS